MLTNKNEQSDMNTKELQHLWLKRKQNKILHGISRFCGEIQDIIRKQYGEIIPTQMIDIMLLFSNHKHIQKMWISMFYKLKQFSFMMKEPCTIQEIKQFETKCKNILNDQTYELPDLLRISLLICNSMQIPPIFRHCFNVQDIETHSSDTLFTSFIYPLNKWKHITDESVKHWNDIIMETIDWLWIDSNNGDTASVNHDTAHRIKRWFNDYNADHQYMFCIGGYYDGDTFSNCIFWNIKTNEILFCESDAQWDGYLKYWSLTEFIKINFVDWNNSNNDGECFGIEDIYDINQYGDDLKNNVLALKEYVEYFADQEFIDNTDRYNEFEKVVCLMIEQNVNNKKRKSTDFADTANPLKKQKLNQRNFKGQNT